jgi:hypothetical protein
MTRSTRAIAAALAALAIGAPAATAMPIRESVSAPSGEAATAPARQDPRGSVARDASVMPQTGTAAAAAQAANGTTTPREVPSYLAGVHPTQRAPVPSHLAGLHPTQRAPVNAASADGGDGTSPLVYILPGVALSVMLAAAMGYALRTSGRARRARVGV